MQLAHTMEGPQGNTCVNLFAQLASTPENFVTSLCLEEHDFTSDGFVDWVYQFLGLGDSWELDSLEQELTDCQVFPSLPGLPFSCCTPFLTSRELSDWKGGDMHALARTHPLHQISKILLRFLQFFQARWSRKGLIPELLLIKWVREEMIHR